MCMIISKAHSKMHLGQKRETGMVRKDNLKNKSCDHDSADIPIHVYSMLSDLIKQFRHALACVACSSPHRQILFELCIDIPLEILFNHSGMNNICSRKIFHKSSWTDGTALKATLVLKVMEGAGHTSGSGQVWSSANCNVQSATA